eukprot:CAMPEP_0117419714 /NCGR_PEP_ID=MMETSP0758-20121206/1214_1 /TAXON_ID=63605 /ORGANISM="Percolomonas cosmopolitus, Strain AE-1 (ATCC 50343)" /LENGTH=346 /DNA_ID=CAMNT_0005200931 /DNA_START=3404 /DNA_END=4442 /DNA_ORIENTATION=+
MHNLELQLLMADDTEDVAFSVDMELFKIHWDDIDLKSKIGHGGSGAVVFSGTWKKHQLCAVKIFQTAFLESKSFLSEFEREVKMLSSMHHPNIVQFYGACNIKPRIAIITEFCTRGDLSSYIEKYSLAGAVMTMKRKCKILLDIAKGMFYIHSYGFIHRDLKCENVLMDENHIAKIADFGCMKSLDDIDQTQRVGTSVYMAPEIVLGESYTEKCDVFSMGILMFVLLTEDPVPYKIDSGYGVELRVANNPNYRPEIPDRFIRSKKWVPYIALMKLCWQADPESRPSFDAIIDELNMMLDNNTTLDTEDSELDLSTSANSGFFSSSYVDSISIRSSGSLPTPPVTPN